MSWKDKFPKNNTYFETDNGILYCNDVVEQLFQFPDESIDLVVTSPPYDNLRYYSAKNERDLQNIWNFEKFKIVAKELYRIMKKGGVVVWVVGDATIKGSETGNSFRQALYFKDECGFKLHDTMIYEKFLFRPIKGRYWQVFEYMFILSKGSPKTFNPIKDRFNKTVGTKRKSGYIRNQQGDMPNKGDDYVISKNSKRTNIWKYKVGYGQSSKDKEAFQHPAIFPEQLARDHIISWSNEGNIVLDPLCGSGTTLKMAEKLNRKWIGIEINPEYCEIAKQRILTLK